MTKQNQISTDELRFKFKRVLEAMEQRRALILTYRNRPIARIEPLDEDEHRCSEEDPFFQLSALAEPMGAADPDELDAEIYGR